MILFIKMRDVISLKKHKIEIIIVVLLLLLSIVGIVIFYLTSFSGKKALVYHNDDIILEVDLDVDKEYHISGDISEMTIIVKDNKLWVSYSGCENQICVHSKSISQTNESITCLPNKIFIKIVGESAYE